MLPTLLLLASALTVPTGTIQKDFAGRPGAFVLIECASVDTFRSDATAWGACPKAAKTNHGSRMPWTAGR